MRSTHLAVGAALAVILPLAACGRSSERTDVARPTAGTPTAVAATPTSVTRTTGASTAAPDLTLSSSAFGPGQEIPTSYTCEGSNTSPPLAWSNVPRDAQTLALVVDDLDAPKKPRFAHWLVYNLPARESALPGGVALPAWIAQGVNDMDKPGYAGPCPPSGRHRYEFNLYALDERLTLKSPDRAALESAMRGHVLASARLVGTYEKHGH